MGPPWLSPSASKRCAMMHKNLTIAAALFKPSSNWISLQPDAGMSCCNMRMVEGFRQALPGSPHTIKLPASILVEYSWVLRKA